MNSILKFVKKRKFTVIACALVAVAIVICIVFGIRSAQYKKVAGRYVNPETGHSIKITYSNNTYTLSGMTVMGLNGYENVIYYCYCNQDGDFYKHRSSSGDWFDMKFHYYGLWNLADEVSCRYRSDDVEETFYFGDTMYIKE